MKIRTLIVDDEQWARRRLTSLLKAESDFELVGECANAEAAVDAIAALNPDVVFLDVQMPEADGFEALEALPPDHLPLVVFVTAYDSYAVRAFEIHAVDYLLKPFDSARFKTTLDRVRRECERGRGEETDGLQKLLRYLRPERRFLQRIGAKTGGRVVFLRSADVDWIEATGNYATLHVGKEAHLIRESIQNLEAKLDPNQFIRIRRSTIVNLDRVKELQPWFHGEQVLVLKDGRQFTVGRVFRDRLKHLLENSPE